MRTPFSPIYLLVFIFLISFLIAFVQLGVVTIVFEKLGLSAEGALTLLFTSLLGSAFNIPLFSVRAEAPDSGLPVPIRGLLHLHPLPFMGRTVIALNIGGGLVPIIFSLYLMQIHQLPWLHILLAIGIISTISYGFSRPIAGLGIGMPILIAPVSAALTAILINPLYSAPLAYIGGTLGVLIGADLLRLKDIRHMGTPMASIGGAGTFDGIFITGLVAVLLA